MCCAAGMRRRRKRAWIAEAEATGAVEGRAATTAAGDVPPPPPAPPLFIGRTPPPSRPPHQHTLPPASSPVNTTTADDDDPPIILLDDAALALDNSFTATTDWALRAFVLSVIPLGAALLTSWRAWVVLGFIGTVSAAMGLHAALFPPPPTAAVPGAAAAWRARRDRATILLRLLYATGVNRAIAAAWIPPPGMANGPLLSGPTSTAAFLAGRYAVAVTFLLTLCARLDYTTARGVALAQAALLILPQRRACVGILAQRPGTVPYFVKGAQQLRAVLGWVVGALLSDGLCEVAVPGNSSAPTLVAPPPPLPPPPTLIPPAAQNACFSVMSALHFAALAVGLALRFRTLAERAGPRPAGWGGRWWGALVRAMGQALAAALVGVAVADAISGGECAAG